MHSPQSCKLLDCCNTSAAPLMHNIPSTCLLSIPELMANSMILTASPWKKYVQSLGLIVGGIGRMADESLKIRALMDKPANIRNMSVIAHGKPTSQLLSPNSPLTLHLGSRPRKIYPYRFPRPARRNYLRRQSRRAAFYGYTQG